MKVLIAGGGVAGAAAACRLGPECVLFEREPGPHDKICGEFISAEAVGYLRQLGMDPAALGAVPVRRVRLIHGETIAAADLPFTAFGLSRRVLDAAMLDRAETLGAEVVRGHAVRRIVDGVPEIGGLGRFPGHAVLLATGKHDVRDLRRTPHREPEDLVGLKMHFALDPGEAAALAGHVEIFLFSDGYGGLQPLENGAANLCVLLERRRFIAAGSDWAGVQASLAAESPLLARRLRGARTLLPRALAVYRVPYGYVHAPSPADPPNVYRLGDQAGVIPSFSGDGMSMAMHSAFSAVASLRDGGAAGYHARLRHDIGGLVARAGWLYRVGRFAPAAVARGARFLPNALRLAARFTRVPSWALEQR